MELLEALRISPQDQRLRLWRREALRLFEQEWDRTMRRGESPDERQIAALYYNCFTGILTEAGVTVPPSLTTADQEAE